MARRLRYALAVLAGAALGALLVLAYYAGAPERPAPVLPVRDGVTAPDTRCVSDPAAVTRIMLTEGRWAGYVDGEVRYLAGQDALALAVADHRMRGVWFCPPVNG